ncbi:hypothetical protein STA1M1_18840 [Sinisalibacter aestuarii]|uniref:Uncharacterized protein n=1 Tax=Sinisalibacter aestuarii TaxID=2949426 RepID=A0ABQ5LUC0_9RHOB|nr:hypothetical protein STA1M1_18840 [Sinisalibacter aestuarii]
MRAVINGGPADIHPHIVRIQRLEKLLRAGGGVVELDLNHVVLAQASRGGLSNFGRERKQKNGPPDDVSR